MIKIYESSGSNTPDSEIIKRIKDAEKTSDIRIEAMFDVLVPRSGKADTVAGELVRAMMRILYRAYNDGDVFYCGYGAESCGTSAEFICDNSSTEIAKSFEKIADNEFGFGKYKEEILKVSDMLVDFIWSNKELISKPNEEDSRQGNGKQRWEFYGSSDCDDDDEYESGWYESDWW